MLLSAGIATINVGAGDTSVSDVNTGKLTLNAAGLGVGATLTLADSTTDTITNLTWNLSAAGDSAALTVTATVATALNIVTGSAAASITDNDLGGSVIVDAAAMSAANILTLKGLAPETVINLAGNIAAGSLTGALTVATTGATQTVTTGSSPTSVSDNSSTLLTINANAMATGSRQGTWPRGRPGQRHPPGAHRHRYPRQRRRAGPRTHSGRDRSDGTPRHG